MNNKTLRFKVFIYLVIISHAYVFMATTVQKVLLISLDGFRWDFQNKTATPNFDWIVKNGISSDFVRNVFPTITLPNHVSIVTGLSPEHHGMITNEMFDPETKEIYDMVKKNNPDKWWVNATPIWIDNELQGHSSGVMKWPGYDVVFNKTKPKYLPNEIKTESYPFHRPDTPVGLTNRADLTCDWLKKDDVTFVALYIEQPDETAHQTGPDRNNTKLDVKIQEVDSLIGKIRRRINNESLDNQVNVIIIGDHGSVDLSHKKVVKLYEFVNITKHARYISGKTFVMIYPKGGFKQYIYKKLSEQTKNNKFKVYLKENIPEKFHLKNNKRVGDILVLCETGWVCKAGPQKEWYDKANKFWKIGDHGFSNYNRDMNPAFYAFGPAFRSGFRKNCINMVDLYSMMCHILKLTPRKNDGDFERIKDVLKN